MQDPSDAASTGGGDVSPAKQPTRLMEELGEIPAEKGKLEVLPYRRSAWRYDAVYGRTRTTRRTRTPRL